MTNKDVVLQALRSQGAADALDLRGRASDLDGTAIIAEEVKVPKFDPEKDYTDWPAGSPVYEEVDDEKQVFKLITPYNASSYEGSPSTLPALWSICHTKDPAKAKPWLAPNGTSGLYALDGCCTELNHVWKNTHDNNEFSPSAMPERWEDLGTIDDVQKG